MQLTVSELGGIFLLGFGLCHWLGILAALRAVMALFGMVIIGSSGMIGRGLSAAGSWAQHAFGAATDWAIGVPLAAGLFITLAVIVVHDLSPKKPAGRRTGIAALALGVIVAAGVIGIPALSGLRGLIVHLAASAVSIVNMAGGR